MEKTLKSHNDTGAAGSGDRPAAAAARSVGFPRSTSQPPDTAPVRTLVAASSRPSPARVAGRPTPKRAKGRWFISLIIISIVATVSISLWNEFFRFQAYGVIDGRVLKLAAPWDGIVQSLHVQDGAYVHQGQLLATMENTELKLRLGKLRDDIRLARAGLETRVAELKAVQRDHSERSIRVHVDYFELLSRYYQEKSRLDEYRSNYRRLKALGDDKTVASVDVEAAAFALEGQQARVTELDAAVKKMKAGLDDAELSAGEKDLLAVEKGRIETLMMEWERLIEYEQLGEIRAPVRGRIVRRHQFTGEFVAASSPIFELLEEGSINAVVYVPQHKAHAFVPGMRAHLSVPPNRRKVQFEVARVADQMLPAPPSLRRHYRSDARLVAIHFRPVRGQLRDTRGDYSMWLGAEVRVPWIGALAKPTARESAAVGQPVTAEQLEIAPADTYAADAPPAEG